MKIFTNEARRAVDAATIESGEATSIQLIEQVAEEAAAEIIRRWKPSKPTAVFAGSGNNGADALAVARLLAEQGFKPQVYLFNIGGNRLSAECRTERDMLLSANIPGVVFTEIVNQLSLPELSRQWLVVDGLFGSGLRDVLSGGFMALVRKINESEATVVSLDVPSGLHGDWNPQSVNRNIIHASLTLGVAFPHIAFFFGENAPMVGEWKVLDLDLSRQAIQSTSSSYYYVERHDVRPLLIPRGQFTSKADYGSAMIIAGSRGMAGAAVLAARGALRSGAGKVTVYGPSCNLPVVQTAIPEAMYVADKQENVIGSMDIPDRYNAVAVGCGIGTDATTIDALERLIKRNNVPLLLDADALNCIARRPSILNFLPKGSVLTPHDGEFDRLFGPQQSAEMRLLKGVEVARRYGVIIVLKGRYTATIRPDGKVYFNSSGTPAMATPGSGDVLTGVIVSLMAQGLAPDMAAVTGVYIHGVAGELAERRHGQYGVLAGDIADNLGKALVETAGA